MNDTVCSVTAHHIEGAKRYFMGYTVLTSADLCIVNYLVDVMNLEDWTTTVTLT